MQLPNEIMAIKTCIKTAHPMTTSAACIGVVSRHCVPHVDVQRLKKFCSTIKPNPKNETGSK